MQIEIKFCTRETRCTSCDQTVELGQLLVFKGEIFGTQAYHLLCLRYELIQAYEERRVESPAETRIMLDSEYREPMVPIQDYDGVYMASGMLFNLLSPPIWGVYDEGGRGQ